MDTDECIIDGTGLIGTLYGPVLILQNFGKIKLYNFTLKRKKSNNDNYSYEYWNLDGDVDIKNCIFDTTSRALIPTGDTEASNCIYRNVNTAVDASGDYKITISNISIIKF